MFLAALLFMPARFLALFPSHHRGASVLETRHIDSRTPGRSWQHIKWSGNLNAILMRIHVSVESASLLVRAALLNPFPIPHSPFPILYFIEAQFHRGNWYTLLKHDVIATPYSTGNQCVSYLCTFMYHRLR